MTFPIIDLVAGMIFIYFLLALVNNSCIELYSAFIKLRASMLKKWIVSAFGNASIDILDHVMLNSLSEKGEATHYINGKNFAGTITELIVRKIQSSEDKT